MGKVITSEGLVDFVQSGKVTHVPDHKPKPVAPEMKAEEKAKELSPPGEPAKSAETPPETANQAEAKADEHDETLTDEEKALPEKAQKEIQRSKRAVNKKHAELMAAKEELAEAERFGELQFNEKKLLEQKIATLQGQLEAAKPAPEPKKEDKPPEMKDFTNEKGEVDWDKYTDAKAEYKAKQAVEAERARQAEEKQAAEIEKLRVKHQTSEDAAKKAHDDWDEVMGKIQGTEADTAPRFVLNFIAESDNSGELRYYLAKHPDELAKIAKMTPIRGIAAMGKIEDSLAKPSEAAKTPAADGATAVPSQRGAPPPITPLNGSGSGAINTDPSKMSYKELRAWHRTKEGRPH